MIGVAAMVGASYVSAEVRFKNIYQNNMVLQADAPNAVAGWADPNADVELLYKATAKGGQTFEKAVKAKADKRGYWEAKIPSFPKRTTLEITAKSGGESAKIGNVLTGELWIGSGQSNMEWNFGAGTVKEEYRAKIQKDIDETDGEIRFFKVQNNTLIRPIDEVSGNWSVIKNPRDGNLSAVAYLFASRLRKELDTPVGIINSSWGGTRIEPWIPQSAFEASEDCREIWGRHIRKVEAFEKVRANYYKMAADFFEKYPTWQLQNQHGDERPPEAYDPTNNRAPSVIYNAKIHGIAPLSPKGVIWYQGESNENDYDEYGKLAKLLVNSWRKHFKNDFWFFYVELAAFTNKQTQPVELNRNSWAYIREAQAEVLELPKTDVAANADTGPEPEPVGDIHPPYKDVPAERLARLALAHVYKKMPLKEAVAPFYKSHKVEGGKMVVDVEYGDGLKKMDKAEKLTGFAIRGDDKNWKWADAEIKGNKIVLSNPEVKNPVAARYGWAKYPLLSVENRYGLPLRPFSTDNGSKTDHDKPNRN